MKICMLDPLFFPYHGGAEKVVYEVGKRLAKEHEITIFTSRLPGTEEREVIEGMEVVRYPCLYLERLPPPLPPPFSIAPLFVRHLLRLPHDIFHVHNRFWYYFGTMFAIKAMMKRKLVVTIHNARPSGIDFLTDLGGGLYDEVIGKRWFELSDRITCTSRYARDATIPVSLHLKTHIIHNGVDVEHFNPAKGAGNVRERFGIPYEHRLLLCNARLVPQKGLSYLLEAFAMLRKDGETKDTWLMLIGKGPLREALLEQARRLGVADRFVITTGIHEEELPFYYNAADLFVLPSLYEPSAVVLYEALAAGKAIVATSVGGNEEIVSRGCGLFVPPRDPRALYEKIKLLLTHDRLRSGLGRAGRMRAVENFDWDLTAWKYGDVYDVLAR